MHSVKRSKRETSIIYWARSPSLSEKCRGFKRLEGKEGRRGKSQTIISSNRLRCNRKGLPFYSNRNDIITWNSFFIIIIMIIVTSHEDSVVSLRMSFRDYEEWVQNVFFFFFENFSLFWNFKIFIDLIFEQFLYNYLMDSWIIRCTIF